MLAYRSILLTLVLAMPLQVVGDEAVDQAPARPPAPAKPQRSVLELIPRQPADDELHLFEPKTPPAPADVARTKAMSWFMAGQLREGRNDFDGALAAYQQAIAANPADLPPYQSLVTIAFAQPSKHNDAKQYALQAAEQADGGVDLLRGLAALFVRGSETSEAIGLLELAITKVDAETSRLDSLLLRRDLGLFSQLSGQAEKALEHYRSVFDVLQADPPVLSMEDRDELLGDAGTTYEQMGKAFLDGKLPDLAVKAFEEAAKFNKGRPGVHSFNLATVYKETGQPEQALKELQAYFDAQLQTKGREAYQLLKELLAETNQTDSLLPRLEDLYDKDPRNVALTYFLAEAYADAGQLDEAEQLIKETLGDGADPRGLVGLASVYRQQGNAPDLFEVLRKAYQVIPQPDEDESELLDRLDADMRAVVEQFRTVQQSIAADGDVMQKLLGIGRARKAEQNNFEFVDAYMLGKLSAAGELIDDAKEFYLTAIDMQNDPPAALYRELGFILTDADRYGEAAEVFGAALTHTSPRLQSPGIQSYFQYLQSHALEMDGQTDAALAAIREARKSQPDNIGLHFQEAWIHYHAHRFDEAIAEFEKVIETYGSQDDPDAKRTVQNCRYSLSAIYVQMGDEVKGEEILLEVYRESPDDTQVNNDLAYLWADQGRKLDEAKTMIAKALAAEPENPAYLDSMGWVLFKLGEYAQAREHLEKAISLPRGQDSTIFDHLGDVYHKLGEQDKAVDAWKQALDLEAADTHPDEKIVNRVKSKLPAE